MSTRSQALRAPSRTFERSGWWSVVAGLVAVAVALAVLVAVATLNAPKNGTSGGSRSGTSQTTVVRVGGDGPYQYHPLP